MTEKFDTFIFFHEENLEKTIIHSRFVSSMWKSEKDSRITEASEAFIYDKRFPRGKHHRGEGKYTLLLNMY